MISKHRVIYSHNLTLFSVVSTVPDLFANIFRRKKWSIYGSSLKNINFTYLICLRFYVSFWCYITTKKKFFKTSNSIIDHTCVIYVKFFLHVFCNLYWTASSIDLCCAQCEENIVYCKCAWNCYLNYIFAAPKLQVFKSK